VSDLTFVTWTKCNPSNALLTQPQLTWNNRKSHTQLLFSKHFDMGNTYGHKVMKTSGILYRETSIIHFFFLKNNQTH
jgi:hypothetical protein